MTKHNEKKKKKSRISHSKERQIISRLPVFILMIDVSRMRDYFAILYVF